MSSILDDFFGDSESAVKECLYCGGTDGVLIVAIEDNYGPTHWHHAECHARHMSNLAASASATMPDFDRDTAANGVE